MTEELSFAFTSTERERWELAGHGWFHLGEHATKGTVIEADGQRLAAERHGLLKGHLTFTDGGGTEIGSFEPDGATKNTARLTLLDRSWSCVSGQHRGIFEISGDQGGARYAVSSDGLAVTITGDLGGGDLALVVGGYLAWIDAAARHRSRTAFIAGAAGAGGAAGG